MAANDIFFELGVSDVGQLLQHGVSHALMLAGITSIRSCERDPVQTRSINVASAGEVISQLSAYGVPVTVVSTNQVFGRSHPLPRVTDQRDPCCEYGRQKADLEDLVLDRGGMVVRCTKVVAPRHSIFSEWIQALRNDSPIRAHENLRMAPLCSETVARSLIEITIAQPKSKIHHLSPATDGTYWEAAVIMADSLEKSRDLVIPTFAHENPRDGVVVRDCAALGVTDVADFAPLGTFKENIIKFTEKELSKMRNS